MANYAINERGFAAVVNSVERIRDNFNTFANQELITIRSIRDDQRLQLPVFERLIQAINQKVIQSQTKLNTPLDKITFKNLKIESTNIVLTAKSVTIEGKGTKTEKESNKQLAKDIGQEIKQNKSNPLQLIGTGLFLGLGGAIGFQFIKGFEQALKQNIGVNAQSAGFGAGNAATNPKQAAVDAINARRKWQLEKQSVEQAQNLAKKQNPNIDPNKLNIFAVGGAGGFKGKSGIGTAKEIRQVFGEENVNVIPSSNKASDANVRFDKDPINFLIQRNLKDFVNLFAKGYNDDAVQLASKVIAAKQKNPNAKIQLVGHSQGGKVVEEAVAILRKAGITDVKGVGIGTPDTGEGFKDKNYQGFFGEKDKIKENPLVKLFAKRSNLNQNIKDVGLISKLEQHKVTDYLRNPEILKAFPKELQNAAVKNALEEQIKSITTIAKTSKLLPVKAKSGAAKILIEEIELARKLISQFNLGETTDLIEKYNQLQESLADVFPSQYFSLKDVKGTGKSNFDRVRNKVFDLSKTEELTKKGFTSQSLGEIDPNLITDPNINGRNTGGKISFSKERTNSLIKGKFTDQLVETLIHEFRHSLQKLIPKSQFITPDFLKGKLPDNIITNLKQRTQSNIGKKNLKDPQDAFDREFDAYAFALIYGNSIKEDLLKTTSKSGKTASSLSLKDKYIVALNKFIEDAQKTAEAKIKGIIPNYSDLSSGQKQQRAREFSAQLNKDAKQFREAIINKDRQLAKELGEKILKDSQAIKKVYDDLIQVLPEGSKDLKSLQGLKGNLTSIQNEVIKGSKGKGRAQIGLTQLIDEAQTTGDDTSKGFIQGIESHLQEIEQSGVDLGEAALDGAKKALDIASPSGEFEDVATNSVDGYVNGLKKAAGKLITSVKTLFSGAVTEASVESSQQLEDTLIATDNILVKFIENITDGINYVFDSLTERFPVLEQFKHILIEVGSWLAFNKIIDIVVSSLSQLAQSSFGVALQFESIQRAMTALSGSSQKGAEGLRFVAQEARNLGIDLKTAEEAYAGLKGATRFTPLEGSQTDTIFSAFSKTAALRGLSNEQQANMFRAINQIISKRKLSAEEVRGQLGEIPGLAFESTLARSIGVNAAQLDERMRAGQLLAADVLPKIAAQYTAENATLSNSSETTSQAINRVNNAILEGQRSFAVLGDGVRLFINFLANGIEWLNQFGPAIGKAFSVIVLQQFLEVVFILIQAFSNASFFVAFFDKTIASLYTRVLIPLWQFLKTLIPQLLSFIKTFILLTLAIEAVTNVFTILNNGFPDLQKNIDATKAKYEQLTTTLENLNKVAQQTNKNLPTNEKEITTDRSLNIFGWNTGLKLEPIRQVLGLRTVGAKEALEFQAGVGDLLLWSDKNLGQFFNSKKILGDIQTIDKELNTIRSRRFNIRPGDRQAFNESMLQEQKLLGRRDDLLKVTAQFQTNLENNKNVIKATLDSLDELVAKKGITQDAEAQIRANLEERLGAIDKTSKAFEDLVSTLDRSVNGLQLSLRKLTEQAAYFNETLERSATNNRVRFLRGAINQGTGQAVIGLGSNDATARTLETKLTFLRDQLGAVSGYLDSPEFSGVLKELKSQSQALGVNLENSATIDRLLQEGRSPQEEAVLNALKTQLELKTQLGQTSEQLAQSLLDQRNALLDFSRTINDYFQQLSQQILTAQVEVDRLLNKLKTTDLKTRLQRALVPGSDTFVNGLISQIQGIFDEAANLTEQIFGQKSARIQFEGEKYSLNTQLLDFTRNVNGATEAIKSFTESLLNRISTPIAPGGNPQDRVGSPSNSNSPSNNSVSNSPSKISLNSQGVRTSFSGNEFGNTRGFVYPVRGGKITGDQGDRHRGVDIFAPVGTPVKSPFSGTLLQAKQGGTINASEDSNPAKPGFQPQHSIVIKLDTPIQINGKTITHAYLTHLTELEANLSNSIGKRIEAGQKLGTVGVAGGAPHLHLGLSETRQFRGNAPLSNRETLALLTSLAVQPHSQNETAGNSPSKSESVRGEASPRHISRFGTNPQYARLGELQGTLSQNPNFSPNTPQGRAALATALIIASGEAGSSWLKQGSNVNLFSGAGGAGGAMRGFAQFNTRYFGGQTSSPQGYTNLLGEILSGKRSLPTGRGKFNPMELANLVGSGQIKTESELLGYLQAKIPIMDWHGLHESGGGGQRIRQSGVLTEALSFLRGSPSNDPIVNQAREGTNQLINIKEGTLNLQDATVRQDIERFILNLRQTREQLIRQFSDGLRQTSTGVLDAQTQLRNIRGQYSTPTASSQLEKELKDLNDQFRGFDNQLFQQERSLSDNILGINKFLKQSSEASKILRATGSPIDRQQADFLDSLTPKLQTDIKAYQEYLAKVQSIRKELQATKVTAENFVESQAKLRDIQRELDTLGKETTNAQQSFNFEEQRTIALKQSELLLEQERTRIRAEVADKPEEQARQLKIAEEQAIIRNKEIEYNAKNQEISRQLQEVNRELANVQKTTNLDKQKELELIQSQLQLEQEILQIKKEYPDLAKQEAEINKAQESARLRERDVNNRINNERLNRRSQVRDLDSQISENQAQLSSDPFDAANIRQDNAIANEQLRFEKQTQEFNQAYGSNPELLNERIGKALTIHQQNIQLIDRQYLDLGETIGKVSIDAIGSFIGALRSGQNAFDAFLNSFLTGLGSIGQNLIMSSIQGFLGIGGGGFAGGFADGGTVGEALRKEGSKGILAVFTPGEEILSLKTGEAQRYQELKQRFGANPLASIPYYKEGGTVEGLLLNKLNMSSPTVRINDRINQNNPNNYQRSSTVNINVSTPNADSFNRSERQLGRLAAEYINRG